MPAWIRSAAAVAALMLSSATWVAAAPCVTDTLTNYTSLIGGCTIGSVQFDSFTLLPASFTQIDSDNVRLLPMATPGFLIDLPTTALGGQTFQSTFSFMASGASFLSGTVGLVGSSVTPDGVNTGSAEFSPGNVGIAFDVGGMEQITDTVLLNSVLSVMTSLDFTIDGGLAGQAVLSQGSISFALDGAGIPEPSSYLLIGSALFGLGWARRAAGRKKEEKR